MPLQEQIKIHMQTLLSGDSEQRQEAAIELMDIGIPAVDDLLQALQHEDAEVRYIVAWALGEIGDLRAAKPLVVALGDDDVRVRDWAMKALAELQSDSLMADLRAALQDDVRRPYAAMVLGWLGDHHAIEALMAMLDDDDAQTRSYAVLALGKLRATEAVPALLAIIADDDKVVRMHIVRTLGEIGDPRAVPELITRLSDRREWVRTHAALALGALKDRQAVPHLAQHLRDDSSANVRAAAAEALGNLGGDEAITALVAALADSSRRVLTSVDIALQQLGYTVD